MIKYKFYKSTKTAIIILFASLLVTISAGYYTWNLTEAQSEIEFSLICKDIETRISTRLQNHAQLLRSGASFIEIYDDIDRIDWHNYYENSKINNNLPGILGLGYSQIISKNQLESHIQGIRSEGFPEYSIYPDNDRDEYTSIIYLEPFNFRNQRAFGYDMFTETVRRKAMEQARDFDIPILSGKVLLVQETDTDLQAGTLMYAPVYSKNLPSNTLEERRAAIRGWVYSPYRMNDLMEGVLGSWDLDNKYRIILEIFDGTISDDILLFASQKKNLDGNSIRREYISTVDFNGTKWMLKFSLLKEPLSLFQSELLLVLVSGVIISFLVYFLLIALFNARNGRTIAEKISSELKENEDKITNLLSEKELILQEVHHRIKNNMSTVRSILNLHAESINDKTAVSALEDAGTRVQSMMILYEKLYVSSDFQEISIKDYFSTLIEDILEIFSKNKSITFEKHIEDFKISAKILFSLGIIVNELLTNIMKYAFKGRLKGSVLISVIEKNGHVTLIIEDDGNGMPEDINFENSNGFGLMLVGILTKQIKGKIRIERKNGTKIILEFEV